MAYMKIVFGFSDCFSFFLGFFFGFLVVCVKRFHCIFYSQTNFLTSNWQKLTSGRAMGQNAGGPKRTPQTIWCERWFQLWKGQHLRQPDMLGLSCRVIASSFCLTFQPTSDGRKKWKVWPENQRKKGLSSRTKRLWPANIDKLKAG